MATVFSGTNLVAMTRKQLVRIAKLVKVAPTIHNNVNTTKSALISAIKAK